MKRRSIATIGFVFIVSLLAYGCGSREADKERARIELEEKAQREGAAGNKAITDLNKRLFGKKPGSATQVQDPSKSVENNASNPPPKP